MASGTTFKLVAIGFNLIPYKYENLAKCILKFGIDPIVSSYCSFREERRLGEKRVITAPIKSAACWETNTFTYVRLEYQKEIFQNL